MASLLPKQTPEDGASGWWFVRDEAGVRHGVVRARFFNPGKRPSRQSVAKVCIVELPDEL